MSSNNAAPLSTKDVNTSLTGSLAQQQQSQDPNSKPDVKSMEYHRQVFQSKMEEEDEYVLLASDPFCWLLRCYYDCFANVARSLSPFHSSNKYISPSDNIMSPCTAKLSAFRNKQVGKYVVTPLLGFVMRNITLFMLTRSLSLPSTRVKPKSLFAQASAKKLEGNGNGDLFGSANNKSNN